MLAAIPGAWLQPRKSVSLICTYTSEGCLESLRASGVERLCPGDYLFHHSAPTASKGEQPVNGFKQGDGFLFPRLRRVQKCVLSCMFNREVICMLAVISP